MVTPHSPDRSAELRTAYARAWRAHPRLELPYGLFVTRCLAAVPNHPEDYYLARACDEGMRGAWERLQSSYQKRLRAFLRKRGAAASEADQLVDEVWGALATPPPRGRARTTLGTYDARGSLYAWLATVLWRRLTDGWRARSAAESGVPPERMSRPVSRDPATHVEDQEMAHRVSLALEAAWAELTERELQAVVLKYRHGLPQKEIARILRVGPPRVTRILHAAAARLRAAIQSSLGDGYANLKPGAGWATLFEVLERVMSRAAAEATEQTAGRKDHG